MAKYTHNLVAETAKEMAGCYYEDAARDNDFFKLFPKQRIFIGKQWRHFIRPAREALTKMLTIEGYPEETKEIILQALLLDRALPPNGDTSVVVPKSKLIH